MMSFRAGGMLGFSFAAAVAVLAGLPSGDAEAKEKACPGGEARLPLTNWCQRKALKYLNAAGGYNEPMQGCEWVVQETEFAGDALLYRAMKCGENVAKLSFAGGAQLAELRIETSSIGFEKGGIVVQVASADPANPTANVQSIARGALDASEAAKCFVRPAGIDSWPTDALVVDVTPEEAAKITEDGPRTACGPYGLDEDSATYWRVFQGFSWFFSLGQEVEYDAGSFTLLTKDASGQWVPVE